MNPSPIEDVLIGGNNNEKKKGKGKGLKIVIFILFLILIIVAGLYWYFVYYNPEETTKTSFFKYVANNNIKYLSNNELYEEIINKYDNSNSESSSSMSFSTTIQNEALEGIDVSKFTIDLNSINDVDNSKTYNELGIKYSDNDLLTLKLISTKDSIAIMSDEIVNKYVGSSRENLSETLEKITGSEIDLTVIDEVTEQVKSADKIDLDENLKQTKINNYYSIISDAIPEENFTKQSNIVITNNSESVTTTAYTLKLTQSELNIALKTLLTELRSDTELLSKLVTGKENTVENTSFDISSGANLNSVSNIENTTFEEGNSPNLNTVSEEEQNQTMQITNNSITINGDDVNETEDNELNVPDTVTENTLDISDLILSIILGNKLETTVENLQSVIDDYISNIDSTSGEGLAITVYVSESGTEKLSMTLPDASTIDIEYDSKSESENTIKITYLSDEEVQTYNEATSEYETEVQRNGYGIEIYKLKNDASTTVRLVFSNIEKNEINQKLSLNLVTTGTVTSKKYTNKLIITYSNSEGEISGTIQNTINFDSVSDIEELNEENCLFLDTLSDEEFQVNIDAINERILQVYEYKKENLELIDTNNQTSVVEQQTAPSVANTNKEIARNILIETISNMMGEASNNDEDFGIKNLENLKIEGHIVSSIINSDLAIITVDGHKFNLDANFNLSDSE